MKDVVECKEPYFTAAKILSPQGENIQSMSAQLDARNAGASLGSSLKGKTKNPIDT